ncbi:hypothetical protein BJX66DRAFT_334192 [Aspergillus keveii]|uniref:Beta-glucuronidase C-terminal domain-containing protein n=1 Tax=Aspergillus keveii TaxID=714993 RepID=A0ABR4GHF6_9EURO
MIRQSKLANRGLKVLDQDEIYGFELGNEIDGFPGLRRDADWSISDYVREWHEYSDAVSEALAEQAPWLQQPLFQGCSFLAPEEVGNNLSYWNVESAMKLGVATGGQLKTIADHKYMGSVCSDSDEAPPTIAFNLLNHTHTEDFLSLHDHLGNYAASQGIQYVLGETGTVSCHGAEDVSSTYAAAIWAVDYLLYLATLKVSRVYFHQGTGFLYSSWMPIANETDGAPRFVYPQYYGNLLTAHALASDEQQVVMVANEPSFTAYGIYAADRSNTETTSHGSSRLRRVVIVNLQEFNATQAAASRPYIEVNLENLLGPACRARDVRVRRLTGPGADPKDGTSFAGLKVDSHGRLVGREKVERLERGAKVFVGATEAVLISIEE